MLRGAGKAEMERGVWKKSQSRGFGEDLRRKGESDLGSKKIKLASQHRTLSGFWGFFKQNKPKNPAPESLPFQSVVWEFS